MQYFHSTVITELVLLLEKVMKVLQEQAFLVCFIKAHNSNYVCEHIQGALVSNVLKFAYTPWPSLLCFHSDNSLSLQEFHFCSVTQTVVLTWLIKFSRCSRKQLQSLWVEELQPRPSSYFTPNKGLPYKQDESCSSFPLASALWWNLSDEHCMLITRTPHCWKQ